MPINTPSLQSILRSEFAHSDLEWISEVRILPGRMVNGTIVSHVFEGLDAHQRQERLSTSLSTHNLQVGFTTLLTPEEATSLELEPDPTTDAAPSYKIPSTWLDLAEALASAVEQAERPSKSDKPRIVTFYSYKGGVGRTTATAHIAYELARRGRKVVLVDMDLEAPGLHRLFETSKRAKTGIVEYLYKLVWGGSQGAIPITDIFEEVRFKTEVKGRLFLVPAGRVDATYISQATTLQIEDIAQPEGPWDRFVAAIKQHLEPDFLLIDSRTGINGWAAFALFRVADQIFIVFQPNTQNLEGLQELAQGMHLLGLGSRVHLIASLIPNTEQGRSKAVGALKVLSDLIYPPEGDAETENDAKEDEAVVPYNPHAALTDQIPTPGIEQYYMASANIIDEIEEEVTLNALLLRADRRRIVESFHFEEVRAEQQMDAQRLHNIFQKTADFNKLLDGPTCLVRGRKGTGKSVLYWLFIKHESFVKDLAGTRLQDKNYRFVSGHGEGSWKPGADELREFDTLVPADQWDVIWRSIVLLRLKEHIGKKMPTAVRKEVWQILKGVDFKDARWGPSHNLAVQQLTHPQMRLNAKYALRAFDEALAALGIEVWLFFDDLDEDLRDRAFRKRVLEGLFGLIQTSDSEGFKAIRFKILLREDLWGELNFQNKSHFDGRYITLQWRREDVLRLALRQAMASQSFAEIVRRIRPIADIDAADEATLYEALEPLWGIRVGRVKSKFVYRWVYERLSDGQGNFFPRSMQHLLLEAQRAELDYLKASSVQAKHDRLVRFDALVAGLRNGASPKRVEELKEEYPDLVPFLQQLKGHKSPLSREEFERLWMNAGKPYSYEVDESITWLTNIGLLREAEDDRNPQLRLSEIYLYGLGMSRDGGP